MRVDHHDAHRNGTSKCATPDLIAAGQIADSVTQNRLLPTQGWTGAHGITAGPDLDRL